MESFLAVLALIGAVIVVSALLSGPATIGFTVAALLMRPVAFLPALIPAPISWRNRGLIAWFGPRGLSSCCSWTPARWSAATTR